MKTRTELIAGMVAQRRPLEEERKAMNLLTKGPSGRAKARAIVEGQMKRDRKISERIVAEAERG